MAVFFVAGLVFLGCSGDSDITISQEASPSQRSPEQWTWHEVTEVISNGMPITDVIAVLGTNYDIVRPFSAVSVPPLRDEDKRASLWYAFEDITISVRTSAHPSSDVYSAVCIGLGTVTSMEKGGQQAAGGDSKRLSDELFGTPQP